MKYMQTPSRQITLRMALASLVLVMTLGTKAQTGTTGYEFLNVPVSAHAAALGGGNVSVMEDDATLLFTNPALTTNVSDRTINFNYMSYMSHSSKLSASFVKQAGARGAWSVAAQLLNYGKMTETTADFQEIGTFKPSDIALQGGYAYLLNDRWSGGVQGKVLQSNYGDYKSMALAVDLGLHYFNEERGFSAGLVARNLGGEVDALYEKNRKLPFNLTLGFSKDLANAPIRISLTFTDLTHWDKDYYAISEGEINGSKKFWNHVEIGADIFPSDQTWIAVGYNCRRAYEMKVQDKSHWAGISVGGGLMVKKFKVGVTYAKYHVSSSSLMINAAFSL